ISSWNSSYTYSIDGGVTFVTGPSMSGLTPNTSYNVVAKNSNGGCVSSSATFTIDPAPVIPVANAGADIQIDDFATVTLNGSASSAGNYSWTSSDPSAVITNPTAAITTVEPKTISTNFILTVTDPLNPGCYSSDIVNVKVAPKPVDIPDAFSPNGDGIHDEFEIRNMKFFQNAVLYIYNQWGELIFKSDPGYPTPWDGMRNGKPVPIGGYFYILELNMAGFKSLTGSITLIK
ncbi:MAG TPA: gliding motility-associated C-terminal domain-containing protein, partial [Cytophagaceae bacterium]|nr:gliding motility-associated C-terminal domain-containing protein [Cytophagaceae bacterium]